MFEQFLADLMALGQDIYQIYSTLFEVFTEPLSEFLQRLPDLPFMPTILDFVRDYLVISGNEITLFGLIFGSGVVVMLVVSLVKWFIGIIT